MADRSLQLRAQEIAIHAGGITVKDALKQALLERYHDLDALAEVAATSIAPSLAGLRKKTYELPENEQGSLFDIPAVIAVRTTEGDLIVPKDEANLRHVRQWVKEGLQHHSVQRLRFKRADQELEDVEDIDDDIRWTKEARNVLGERKAKALEDGDQE